MVQGRTHKDNFTPRTQTIGLPALSSHLAPFTVQPASSLSPDRH